MSASLRTRLFVSSPLAAQTLVPLRPEQVHYLRNVLRLSAGVEVALFNGKDGEWRGRIENLAKETGDVRAEACLRPQRPAPDLWLLFAPIKRQGIDLIAEKASELGVCDILPVMTRHTDVARVNIERFTANAIEAAEQSERMCVPLVHEPTKLADVLAKWPQDRPLIVCAEAGPAKPALEALSPLKGQKAAILIGPEGGFSRAELDQLTALPFVVPIRLGPRVLRAETAVMAALSCWQAICGDWLE